MARQDNGLQQLSRKTFGNQSLLPPRPVPNLHETCTKFIEWVQPLLSEEEFNTTKHRAEEFQRQGGGGETLQKVLIQWSQQPEQSNWFEPFWEDLYLKHRSPLVINMNYFLVFDIPPAFADLPQLKQTAALILAILQFKSLLDREELEPDVIKGTPLCMKQFKKLFSTTRIPKQGRDILRSPVSEENSTSPSEKHILVLYHGHLFTMEVLSEAGVLPTLQELEEDLKKIVAIGAAPPKDDETIGILTTMQRDEWADARTKLLAQDPQNAVSMEKLETALFAICLEDSNPETSDDFAKILLHSDGRNRWFDKSLQFIICQNGKIGVNVEHTDLDALTVRKLAWFFPHANADAESGTEKKTSERETPQKLTFHLDDDIKQIITEAVRSFDAFVDDTQIQVLEFETFGKELIKTFRLSPDAFIQLSLQLAQYQTLGQCRSTYESVTLKQFLHGRTEAMRSVSSEVVRFVETMTSEHCDAAAKIKSLQDAVQQHGARMKECQVGMGVQRHLYGLFMMYQRFGCEHGIVAEPAIFSDKGWRTLCYDTLSTSNAGAGGITLFGFGPVVDDGFGIGYLIDADYIRFTITNRTQNKEQLMQFVSHLSHALTDMAALMQTTE